MASQSSCGTSVTIAKPFHPSVQPGTVVASSRRVLLVRQARWGRTQATSLGRPEESLQYSIVTYQVISSSCPAAFRHSSATMTEISQAQGALQLAADAHVKYVQSLDSKKDELDYWLTEHLRLNGVYWGLVALHLLGRPDALPRQQTVDFVLSCQHDSGGFGAAPGHDAHMLSTVSAVQILAMVDGLAELETRGPGKAKVGQCKPVQYSNYRSLYRPDL